VKDSENGGSWKNNTFVLKMQCLGSLSQRKPLGYLTWRKANAKSDKSMLLILI